MALAFELPWQLGVAFAISLSRCYVQLRSISLVSLNDDVWPIQWVFVLRYLRHFPLFRKNNAGSIL